MHNGMAVLVKIESLLPHGRCRQNKRPERRIERSPDLIRARRLSSRLRLILAQPCGEPSAHPMRNEGYSAVRLGYANLLHDERCRPQRDCLPHDLRQPARGISSGLIDQYLCALEDLGVLI